MIFSGLFCACIKLSNHVLFTVNNIFSFSASFVTSFVSLSSIIAIFFTSTFSFSNGFTLTVKLNVAVFSPAGTVTVMPFSKSVCVYSVSLSLIFIDFSTNVVYSDILSFTIASPGLFPEFDNFIVYVIISFSFTLSSGVFVFIPVIFTVSVISGFVGFSSSLPIRAMFLISPCIFFILIVNITFASPCADTSISFIPFIKSSAFLSFETISSSFNIDTSPTISAFPSANISFKSISFTVVFPSISPVFFTVIVYVILSFIFAGSCIVFQFSLNSLDTILVFSCSIIAVFTSSDGVPFAIAIFKIVPVIFSFTFTVNCIPTVSSDFISIYHFNPITLLFSFIFNELSCVST